MAAAIAAARANGRPDLGWVDRDGTRRTGPDLKARRTADATDFVEIAPSRGGAH